MNADEKQQKPPPLSLPDEDDWSPGRSTPVPEPAPPKAKAKALVRRPAQPTIADLSGHASVGGGTLRPPGAVPPPARGAARSVLNEKGDAELEHPATASVSSMALVQRGQTHRPSSSLLRRSIRPAPNTANASTAVASSSGLATPTPSAPDPSSSPPDLELPPRHTLPSPAAGNSRPGTHDGERTSANGEHSTSQTDGAVGAAFVTAHADPHSRAAPIPAAPTPSGRTRSRLRNWIGFLVAASVTLGVGMSLRMRPVAAPSPKIAPSSSPIAKRPVVCVLAEPARRIAPTILMSVAPIAGDGLMGGRIMIGFAENPTTAVGLAVDPNDLDIAIPYREQGDQRVVSVTPFESDGQHRFFDWRERDGLRKGRLVNGSIRFALGLSDSGFARQPMGGSVETVWPLEKQVAVTDPRIASLPGKGHAVTFRQGGQTGALMLGWLTESGQALVGPHQVDSPVAMLGTPTVAANSHTALLAFAGKTAEPAAWSLYLSRARYGQLPEPAIALQLPSDGPGGDMIAPALTQIMQDQWLLQWSEGPPGQRQVRVQTLDEMGHPLGVAHTVSPVGSNSGQGLLWSSGTRAVSLFIASSGKSAELWATPMTCQP